MGLDLLVLAAVLAVLCGMTLMAWIRPRACDKLYWPMQMVVSAAFVGGLGWDASNAYTRYALAPFLEPARLEAARTVANRLLVADWRLLALYLGASAYLILLAFFQAEGRAGQAEPENGEEAVESKSP